MPAPPHFPVPGADPEAGPYRVAGTQDRLPDEDAPDLERAEHELRPVRAEDVEWIGGTAVRPPPAITSPAAEPGAGARPRGASPRGGLMVDQDPVGLRILADVAGRRMERPPPTWQRFAMVPLFAGAVLLARALGPVVWIALAAIAITYLVWRARARRGRGGW